jgi:FtsP/CotA-like multicopper oxidase with cupredoxin domain
VVEGDIVTVNLYNNLSESVSIIFPGQSLDGVGTSSFRTRWELRPAAARPSFTASAPGTTLYESGTNASVQVAMGLYGALIVRPTTAGQAYNDPDTAYDAEAILVLSEVDPDLNQSADPNTFNFVDYAPKYWLMNGEAYPDTDPIPVTAGDRLLMRYLNAGLAQHTMAVLGFHQTVVAGDGYPQLPVPGGFSHNRLRPDVRPDRHGAGGHYRHDTVPLVQREPACQQPGELPGRHAHLRGGIGWRPRSRHHRAGNK